MPKKNTRTVVRSSFQNADEAARKSAFTRCMARWINGAEKRKAEDKPQ